MLVEILVLILLAVAVIYVLRARRQLAELAEQIRELRTHAMQPIDYRPLGSPDLADELVTITAEAEKAGFTMLGDFVEESPVRDAGMPMRWFTDSRGTTFGWMAPFDLPPQRIRVAARSGKAGPFEVRGTRSIVIVLMSHELATQTITSRAPKASLLSRPPFVQVQHVPLTASFKDTVARHRELAKLDDETRGFVPVKTFDQLRHELERMRSKVIAWREHQAADELLEADLKSLLGPQYRRLGSAMRRRLA